MLSLRDVHVHIGKLHILQGVSLEVKEGECAALLARITTPAMSPSTSRPRCMVPPWIMKRTGDVRHPNNLP